MYDKIGIRTQMFFMKKSKFFELFVTKNDERVHSLCLIHHAQVLNKICVSNCALKCEKQSNRREIRENQKKHLKTTSGRKGLNQTSMIQMC